MCNFIEWVDTENPQNNGTRGYSRSETRSEYLRRKDEHERRIAREALEWQVNLLGLPTWRERPECRCGDRCQVIRSVRQRTRGQRCFVCPNIVDDDFVVSIIFFGTTNRYFPALTYSYKIVQIGGCKEMSIRTVDRYSQSYFHQSNDNAT